LDILSLPPALELLPPEDPATNLEACCTTSRHRNLVDLAGGHLTKKGNPNKACRGINSICSPNEMDAVIVDKASIGGYKLDRSYQLIHVHTATRQTQLAKRTLRRICAGKPATFEPTRIDTTRARKVQGRARKRKHRQFDRRS